MHGFPVVDEDKNLIGLITREALMVLLGAKCWIEEDANSKIEIVKNMHSSGLQNIERRFSSMSASLAKPPVPTGSRYT